MQSYLSQHSSGELNESKSQATNESRSEGSIVVEPVSRLQQTPTNVQYH